MSHKLFILFVFPMLICALNVQAGESSEGTRIEARPQGLMNYVPSLLDWQIERGIQRLNNSMW